MNDGTKVKARYNAFKSKMTIRGFKDWQKLM